MKMHLIAITLLSVLSLPALAAHWETLRTSASDPKCGKAGVKATQQCSDIESRFPAEKRAKVFHHEIEYVEDFQHGVFKDGVPHNECNVIVECSYGISDL